MKKLAFRPVLFLGLSLTGLCLGLISSGCDKGGTPPKSTNVSGKVIGSDGKPVHRWKIKFRWVDTGAENFTEIHQGRYLMAQVMPGKVEIALERSAEAVYPQPPEVKKPGTGRERPDEKKPPLPPGGKKPPQLPVPQGQEKKDGTANVPEEYLSYETSGLTHEIYLDRPNNDLDFRLIPVVPEEKAPPPPP